MDQIKKTDGLPSELTVEVLIRGALTLEQGESDKVFELLKKGLENLISAQKIKNSVAAEFKRRKNSEKEKAMNKKSSRGYYGLSRTPFFRQSLEYAHDTVPDIVSRISSAAS